jgi:hypothetical protein
MGGSISVQNNPTVPAAKILHPVPYQKNTIETNILVWLDSDVNRNEENRRIQQQLFNINNHVQTFEDPHECQQYVQRLPTKYRITLIVSGRLGREIIPYIHPLNQISSIYVFCSEKRKNEQWALQYHKVGKPFVSV